MPDQPNSAEDTDSVKRDLDEIPDALAWLTASPGDDCHGERHRSLQVRVQDLT